MHRVHMQTRSSSLMGYWINCSRKMQKVRNRRPEKVYYKQICVTVHAKDVNEILN